MSWDTESYDQALHSREGTRPSPGAVTAGQGLLPRLALGLVWFSDFGVLKLISTASALRAAEGGWDTPLWSFPESPVGASRWWHEQR